MHEIGVNRTLGEIASIEMGQSPNGNSYNTLGEGIPLINGPTEFTNHNPVPVQWTTRPTKICKNGDLLLCVRGSSVGRINIADNEFCIGRGVAAIRASSKNIQQSFLIELIKYEVEKVVRLSSGSTFPNIDKTTLASCKVKIPSFKEQQKIAAILRTWDDAIEKIEKVIQSKEIKKSALAQRLLTGKLRAQGFSNPLKIVKFGEVTTEVKTRNQDNSLNTDKIMGVNKFHGLIPMRQETIGAKIDRYKEVPPKAFAYNPMRINIGSLAMSERNEKILVSPDYVVFLCNQNKLDAEYFNHFRRSHIWGQYMAMAGNGGVRIRIYYNDLADMRIRLPSIEEQKIIVQVFNECDSELKKLRELLGKLKKQKRGLMQKLLTGEWRIGISEKEVK